MKRLFLFLLTAVFAYAQPTLPTPTTKTVVVDGSDGYVLKYPTAQQLTDANGIATTAELTAKSPAQSVVYNGSAGSPVYGLTADGTGDFTWLINYNLPSISGVNVAFATANTSLFYNSGGRCYVLNHDTGIVPTAAVPQSVAITRSSGVATPYLNGTALATFNMADDLEVPTLVGNTTSGNYPWSGPLSVAKILGTSTPAEIAAAYKGQPPRWWFPSVPAGTQLITGSNSDFSSDTGFWSKGTNASITGGKLVLSGVSNGSAAIYRSGLLVVGQKYRVTFTISNYVGGGAFPQLGSTAGTSRTANGTYTEDIVCGSNDVFYGIVASGSLACDIDNITLQVLGAQLYPDANQPGTGSLIRSVGNVPGYAVKASTNSWLYPSSQYERSDIDTRANSAATRQMLVMNGSQGYTYTNLGFNVGTAPWELLLDADFPSTNPASPRGLVYLSTGGYATSKSLQVQFETNGTLYLRLFGSSTSNYVEYIVSDVVSMYGGKRGAIRVQRTSGDSIGIWINGSPVTYTKLVTGTGSDGDLVTTYMSVGCIGSGAVYPFAGPLTASLLLGNLTESEAATWNSTCVLPARCYVAGGAGPILDSSNATFTTDTYWSKSGGATISTGDGQATIPTNGFLSRLAVYKRGVSYFYEIDIAENAGSVLIYNGYNGGGGASALITGTGVFRGVITNTDANLGHEDALYVQALGGQAKLNSFQATSLGVAFQLDPNSRGIGSVGYDISGAARNLTLGSGVTWAVPGSGNSETSATGYSYFGDEQTNGSWRIGISGANLIIQKRESGSWVTKQTITP